MRKIRPSSDADMPILNPDYAPRNAQAIPTAAIGDSPSYCIEINQDWLPHIVGALMVLDQPDAWIGTEAEIEEARNQIRQLCAAVLCP